MNLAFDPWIPCVRDDGSACSASLVQCFTDAGIVDVAVRPHERVALMRLLLCVAYAACGVPADYEEWTVCRERLPQEVAAYLDKWRDSFELFHPQKPFLQVAGLKSKTGKKGAEDNEEEESGPTSTAKLDFALAAGNNSTLFDHEALNPRRAAVPEKLALDLLTFQMFSVGGRIGKVLWAEKPMWLPKEDKQSTAASIDAPCVPGSMLHTFLRGRNLTESIFLNMAAADELSAYAALGGNWQGRPLWEQFPAEPDDKAAVENATRTFLGRLVPLARAVLLSADGKTMLLGNGLLYPTFTNSTNPFPAEFSATVVTRGEKNELTLLGLQPGKALWRQLHALTVKRHDGLGGCIAIQHCDGETDVDIVVDGLARDQAKIEDAVESVFHVPRTMFAEAGHKTYEAGVQQAEELEWTLGRAVEIWRAVVDGGWTGRLKMAGAKKNDERAKLRALAFREYWTAVEHNLPLLLAMTTALGSPEFPEKQAAWRTLLRQSALRAYEMACGRDNERQMRAFVAGKRLLLNRARKIQGQAEKEKQ